MRKIQVRTVLVASAIRATVAPSDALARYGPLTAVATPPWRTPKRTKEANESGDDHEYPDNRRRCLHYRPPSITVNRLKLLGAGGENTPSGAAATSSRSSKCGDRKSVV